MYIIYLACDARILFIARSAAMNNYQQPGRPRPSVIELLNLAVAIASLVFAVCSNQGKSLRHPDVQHKEPEEQSSSDDYKLRDADRYSKRQISEY